MDTISALEHASHAHKQIGTDLNRVYAIYTRKTDEKFWEQQYVLETFDTALEQEWIKIYYQAIMRTKTGRAAALEALAAALGKNELGIEDIVAAGLAGKNDLVKVLGNGEITAALNVTADAFSKTAIAKIEAAGGKAIVTE